MFVCMEIECLVASDRTLSSIESLANAIEPPQSELSRRAELIPIER